MSYTRHSTVFWFLTFFFGALSVFIFFTEDGIPMLLVFLVPIFFAVMAVFLTHGVSIGGGYVSLTQGYGITQKDIPIVDIENVELLEDSFRAKVSSRNIFEKTNAWIHPMEEWWTTTHLVKITTHDGKEYFIQARDAEQIFDAINKAYSSLDTQ